LSGAATGGEGLYQALMARAGAAGRDLFDAHVAASILALALRESAEEAVAAGERCGLDAAGFAGLADLLFPGWTPPATAAPVTQANEQALRDILMMHCAEASPFEMLAVAMIARRCLRPNHLWQDLGLANRGELSMLMQRHFPGLALRNSGDMKWKKFFYRMMCSSEQFRLCAAPVCSECDDFDACFGSEDGEALLARVANGRLAGPNTEARL